MSGREILMTDNELARGEPLAGCLDGLDETGRVYFLPDGGREAVPVILGLAATDAEVVRAALDGRRALVLRVAGDSDQLVLVSLLRDRVTDVEPREIQEEVTLPDTRLDEAVVDGKVVRFEAREEIVLRCGKGSITLRKDGKIVIKGTHLLSRAAGVNRIKGGQVNIN